MTYSVGATLCGVGNLARAGGRVGPGMVAAADLVDRVHEDRPQHAHPRPNPARCPRQVDDQRPPRHPREPPGQDRRRYPGGGAGRPQGLGDPGDLPVDHPPGHLGGQIGRGQAGAAGGHGDVVAGRHRVAQHLLNGLAVGDHQRPVDAVAPGRAEQFHQHRAGTVRVHPGRRPVGHGDREPLDHARRQAPDRPPSLASSRTSMITALLSTALIMSISVSAAIDTEVSASISTPVRSAVRTWAVISTPESDTARSTVTPWIASGWQSGIRSGVRLAPAIPAIRATARASPLGTVPSRSAATASADSSTRPDAVAVRTVTSLAETSTIRARPASSRCVSFGGAASVMREGYASPPADLNSRSRSQPAGVTNAAYSHGNMRTSTVSPAGSLVSHSGTRMSAVARPSEAIWCEPCPDSGVTLAPSSTPRR